MVPELSKRGEWWMRGNFYSLYIDKFAGDIPGLIKKLDYFTELGIDCLHILPHYPSPMRDGGFDITDHIGVREELGTVEDFKNLCQEAKQKGIRIMVDLVLNHVSVDHPWFVEARQFKSSSFRDFFLWSDTGTELADSVNIFPDFKDKNWIYNEATKGYYYATFKPSQPDLNWHNPEVLQSMLLVVDTLVGYGVDGFRLDAIMNLVELEGTSSVGLPETHAIIRKLRTHIEQYHPEVILLGEVVGSTEFSLPYFGKSDECHLSYNFELMNEMLYALVCGDRSDRLRALVETSRNLPLNTSWMTFLRNHDSLTLSTLDVAREQELLNAIDPNREFMFAGGRETAQRLFNILRKNPELMKEAFSMLSALPTAIVIYYGDEIGLENIPLKDGEDDMRLVVRGEFDWNEFERQKRDLNSLFYFVKKTLAKRR